MAAFRWNLWFCLMLVIMIIFIRLGQSHPFYRRTIDANATTDDSFPGPQVTNSDRESAVSVQTECDPDSGRANITIVVFPGERFVTYTQVICHNNVFPVLMGFSNIYFPNSTMRDHQFLCLFDGPFQDSASASVVYNATVSLFWDDGKGSLFESKCLVSEDKLSMDVDYTTLLPGSTMKDSNTDMGVITDTMQGQIGKDESSDITTHSFEDPVSKTTECKNRSLENMPPAFPVGAVVGEDIFTPSTEMNSQKSDQTTFPNAIVHTGSTSTAKSFDTFTSSDFSFENMVSKETVPFEESDPSNQMDDVQNQSPTLASPLDDLPKLQIPSSTISSSVAVQTTVSSNEAIHSPITSEVIAPELHSSISVYPKTMSAVMSISSHSEHKPTIMRVLSQSSKFNIELKNQSTINSSTTETLENGTLSDNKHPNYSPANLSEVQVKAYSSSTKTINPTTSSTISQYEFYEKTSESMINLMPSTKPMSEIKTFILETSSRTLEQNPPISSSMESTKIHWNYPMHTLAELDSSKASKTQMKISHLIVTGSFSFTADVNVETVTKPQGMLQSQMVKDVVVENETLSDNIQKPLRTSLIKVSNKEDSIQNKMTSTTSTESNPNEENSRKYKTTELSTAPFLSTDSWEGHEEKTPKQMSSTEHSQQNRTEEISSKTTQSIAVSATKGKTTKVASKSVETSTNTQPYDSVSSSSPLETVHLSSLEAASKSKETENTEITDARPTVKSTYEMAEVKTTVAIQIISPTDANPGGKQTTNEHQTRMTDAMQKSSMLTDAMPMSKPENYIPATSKDAKPLTVSTSRTSINPKRKAATTEATTNLSIKEILPEMELSSTANTTPKSVIPNVTQVIRSFFDERPFNERFLEKKTSSPEISGSQSKQLLPNNAIISFSTAEPLNKAMNSGSKDSLSKSTEFSNSVPSSKLSTATASTNSVLTGESLDKSTKAAYKGKVNPEDSIDEMKDKVPEGETTDTAHHGKPTYTTKNDGPTDAPMTDERTGAMQKGESTTEALLNDVTTGKTTDAMSSVATMKPNTSVSRAETNASDKASTQKPSAISYETTSIQQSSSKIDSPALSSTQASPRLEKSNVPTSKSHFSTGTPPEVRSDNAPMHPDSRKSTTTTMQKTMRPKESTPYSHTNLPPTESLSVFQESTPSMVSSSSPEAESTTATSTRKPSMWSLTDKAENDKTEPPPLKVVQSKSNIFLNKQAK